MSEDKHIQHYMVEFSVPSPFPQHLYEIIPHQRVSVNELFTAGKLISYTLSMDMTRLWAVFLASTESELITLVDRLPLSQYMDYNYSELRFHQSLKLLPAMSLN